MKLAGKFSFNGGEEYVKSHHPNLLKEVEQCIENIEAEHCKTKKNKEVTMSGRMLYSPREFNKSFEREFTSLEWTKSIRVKCEYSKQHYVDGYEPEARGVKYPFREMDFVKQKLGVEVQFGKYAFMVYNVCAKMTIFNKLGYIDAGVEIVPVRQLTRQMSTGVSFFEQFVWDLEQRGVSDIDIPVLIIGIDA